MFHCTVYSKIFAGHKISPSPGIYLCIAEILDGINFHQCGNGHHILNTGQKIQVKILPTRAGGEIGENFLLAKISTWYIYTCCWLWFWRCWLCGFLHEHTVEESPSLIQRGAWHWEHLGAVLHIWIKVTRTVCAHYLNIHACNTHRVMSAWTSIIAHSTHIIHVIAGFQI